MKKICYLCCCKVSFLFLLIFISPLILLGADISGKISTRKIKSPNDILVYIEKAEGQFPLPSTNPRMDQKNLVFIPKVLPVLQGTGVEFHNSDKARHNVLGVGDDKFDLGTWGEGAKKIRTFNNLGVATILCNIHSEMESFIVVLQNPYFALTDKEGNYKIENIPEGMYKLKTWHNKLKSQTKEVNLPAEGFITVDFEF